jgi:tetratricopeptide (TPR) repeat protein
VSFFEPKNLLTGLLALVGCAWAGYAIFIHDPSGKAAGTTAAPSEFALKPSRQLEIRALLIDGKIDQLEKLLTGLQDQFERKDIDGYQVSYAFSAFETSDPAIEGPLDKWNRARPNSFAAALARARYQVALAWLSRGTAITRETPKARFAAMYAHLRRARADVIRAHTLRPRLIAAVPTMIEAAYHLNSSGELRKRIGELGHRYPCSALLHWAVLPYLQPKWSGSLARIDAYTAYVSNHCPHRNDVLIYREVARGDLEYDRGNRRAAIRRYTNALRRFRAPAYYYMRGKLNYELDLDEAAFADFAHAFALDQEDTRILSSLASVLFLRGRKSEAMRLWRRALALDPYNPKLLMTRAWFLTSADGYPAAWYEMADADLEKARRYGADRVRIDRMQLTARGKRRALPDGIAFLRRKYYANPRDQAAFVYYLTELRGRFRCSHADELRALLKHCLKFGHCTQSSAHLYNLELERQLKYLHCGGQSANSGNPKKQ